MDPPDSGSGSESDSDEEELLIEENGDVSTVIFPAGTDPNLYPLDLLMPNLLGPLGAFLDLAEFAAILIPHDAILADILLSILDVVVTSGACVGAGGCYYGQPFNGAPNMLVVNQDVVVTGGDLLLPVIVTEVLAPIAGPGALLGHVGTDLVTTAGSWVYDVKRLQGEIPNYLSVGFSVDRTSSHLQIYILIYPP